MLYIDNKNIKVIEQKIYVMKYNRDGNKGYSVNIYLFFTNTDTKKNGYINLSAGFAKEDNITYFLNREYNGINGMLFGDDIFFEGFDTEEYFDTGIESNIVIKLKEIKDNKVKTYFEVDDELIKVKFDGFLNLDFIKTKDNFKSED